MSAEAGQLNPGQWATLMAAAVEAVPVAGAIDSVWYDQVERVAAELATRAVSLSQTKIEIVRTWVGRLGRIENPARNQSGDVVEGLAKIWFRVDHDLGQGRHDDYGWVNRRTAEGKALLDEVAKIPEGTPVRFRKRHRTVGDNTRPYIESVVPDVAAADGAEASASTPEAETDGNNIVPLRGDGGGEAEGDTWVPASPRELVTAAERLGISPGEVRDTLCSLFGELPEGERRTKNQLTVAWRYLTAEQRVEQSS